MTTHTHQSTMRGVTIRALEERDAANAAALWDACLATPCATPYAPLTAQEFDTLFRVPSDRFAKVSLVAVDGERLVGFANGTVLPDAEQAYLTTIAVHPEFRGRGTGTRLLGHLESDLRERPEAVHLTRFEVMFFNPITLTWIIPGTNGHDHPNTPGVDTAGPGYVFLKNRGYRDLAYQNSYYLRLSDYQPPANIQEIMDRLASAGLRICRYDPDRHLGLEELFTDLGNEDWRSIVLANCAPGGAGETVLIVEDGDRVAGFTGPLHVQPSGRGYLAGIGSHSAYRGRGAAKALFSALCTELKTMGASFMSLFTGETNPARNIYEAAGFRIVRCWADMKKEARR